jgi:hypothetical protein
VVVAVFLAVREQAQAGRVLVLENWLLCWLTRKLIVVRGGPLNARALVRRPGLLRVEPHVISRQRVTEGVAPHGLAQAWVPALRVQRLVLGEVEPVQRGAV